MVMLHSRYRPSIREVSRTDVQNCTLKLSDDPSVDEVWVWPAGQKIEAKKDGKGLSDQQAKDFETMMKVEPVIVIEC
jgi:hypothetical protein